MKIIENNYKPVNLPIKYICEECDSVFQYDENDINIEKNGDEYVICPCCGHKCLICEKITEKNIEFPKSFYEFGGNNINSLNVSDIEITERIKQSIEWLKENPAEPYKYMGYGNMFLCIFNHEDEYYIIVTKNYFDTTIDK